MCKRQRYAFPDFAGCLSFQSGQGKEYNDFNNLAGSPDDVFTRFQLLADAHIHITRENCRAMLDHMDSLGIDRALLMAFDEESAEVNFDLAREHPQRFLARSAVRQDWESSWSTGRSMIPTSGASSPSARNWSFQ